MKKIRVIALVLCLVMSVSLFAGCGQNSKNGIKITCNLCVKPYRKPFMEYNFFQFKGISLCICMAYFSLDFNNFDNYKLQKNQPCCRISSNSLSFVGNIRGIFNIYDFSSKCVK